MTPGIGIATGSIVRILAACSILFMPLIIAIGEISQAFLPTRACDPHDWLADLTGLTLGQSAALTIEPRMRHL